MTLDIAMTCCRDEADVIGTFVRYYVAAGFDRVHVVDNGSRDGSPEIVRGLAEAGLPVDLTVDPRDGYELHLTEWYRAVGRRWQPRWLFFLDCDEFILFPGGAKAWLDALAPGVNRLRFRQKEMHPVPDGEDRHFLLSTRADARIADTTKDMARWERDARILAGKHRVELSRPVTHVPEDALIRHYKYRSLDQARAKERNRVAVHRVYSDEELSGITAFTLGRSRGWFEQCAAALEAEMWRDSFAADRPGVEDGAMAEHAAELLCRGAGAPAREGGP